MTEHRFDHLKGK